MIARRLGLAVWLTIAALVGARPAAAQCRISTADGVSFGAYDVFDPAPLDSLGRIVIACWPPGWVEIDLSRGQAPTFFPRRMTGGGSWMNYNLYLDAARSRVWGDGTGGTQVFRAHGRSLTAFIYGRIPQRQDVAAGAYTDQVTIVIQF